MPTSSASQPGLRRQFPAAVSAGVSVHGFARVVEILQGGACAAALNCLHLGRFIRAGGFVEAYQGVALLADPPEAVPVVLLIDSRPGAAEADAVLRQVDRLHASWEPHGELLRIMRYAGVHEVGGRLAQVVEPCPGDLWSREHRRLPWPEPLLLASELLRYFGRLHDAGYHDSDICPQNLLVSRAYEQLVVTKIDHGALRPFAWYEQTDQVHAHRSYAFIDVYRDLIARGPCTQMRSRLDTCALYAIGCTVLWAITGREPVRNGDPTLILRPEAIPGDGELGERLRRWIRWSLGVASGRPDYQEMVAEISKIYGSYRRRTSAQVRSSRLDNCTTDVVIEP